MSTTFPAVAPARCLVPRCAYLAEYITEGVESHRCTGFGRLSEHCGFHETADQVRARVHVTDAMRFMGSEG